MGNNGFALQRPMLSFGEDLNNGLNKNATFSDLTRCSEYLLSMVFNWFVFLVAIVFAIVLGTNFGPLPYGIFYIVAILDLFITYFAVCVRRLQDIGKSGWNFLLSLAPIVSGIFLLVWFCSDSQKGSNRFGEFPKYA